MNNEAVEMKGPKSLMTTDKEISTLSKLLVFFLFAVTCCQIDASVQFMPIAMNREAIRTVAGIQQVLNTCEMSLPL